MLPSTKKPAERAMKRFNVLKFNNNYQIIMSDGIAADLLELLEEFDDGELGPELYTLREQFRYVVNSPLHSFFASRNKDDPKSRPESSR